MEADLETLDLLEANQEFDFGGEHCDGGRHRGQGIIRGHPIVGPWISKGKEYDLRATESLKARYPTEGE